MTLAAFIEVLTAFFKFPDAMRKLAKYISKTPQEAQDDLIKKIDSAFDEKANGGRPGDL